MEVEDLKELLIKCWMTHDGMWFYHCQKECGMEKTNKINKAAINSLAKIEIKRIQNAFGIKSVKNFKDLQNLIDKALEVFRGEFMRFEYHFTVKNQLHCEMQNCWAYNGIKQIGVIDQYECGIFERIEGWFNTLNIDYDVTPQLEGCLMHSNGKCYRNYTFFFEK